MYNDKSQFVKSMPHMEIKKTWKYLLFSGRVFILSA